MRGQRGGRGGSGGEAVALLITGDSFKEEIAIALEEAEKQDLGGRRGVGGWGGRMDGCSQLSSLSTF